MHYAKGIKIKFKCACGKKLKASVGGDAESRQCPTCHRPIVLPEKGDPCILAVTCSCGHLVTPLSIICIRCGRPLSAMSPQPEPISSLSEVAPAKQAAQVTPSEETALDVGVVNKEQEDSTRMEAAAKEEKISQPNPPATYSHRPLAQKFSLERFIFFITTLFYTVYLVANEYHLKPQWRRNIQELERALGNLREFQGKLRVEDEKGAVIEEYELEPARALPRNSLEKMTPDDRYYILPKILEQKQVGLNTELRYIATTTWIFKISAAGMIDSEIEVGRDNAVLTVVLRPR